MDEPPRGWLRRALEAISLSTLVRGCWAGTLLGMKLGNESTEAEHCVIWPRLRRPGNWTMAMGRARSEFGGEGEDFPRLADPEPIMWVSCGMQNVGCLNGQVRGGKECRFDLH